MLDKKTNDYLHSRLVKLGDMIGEGEAPPEAHREYKRILKQLGYIQSPPRADNSAEINKAVSAALEKQDCPKCGGKLKQTRKGSLTVICTDCETKLRFKRKRVSKNGKK
ncbi:hypothetical protein SM030_00088 [Vibrio phage vB_VpaS_sm030]|nr:hypothetical protein SM030_00088 [Vibrio phage vB_VpaS_sm030]CAI5930290.1 hypothetical protein SM031_00088 [Vibrio phage vB_VpaS_sm030]CAI6013150.1 hypothetical protein SM032_00088 [Vibrio phage vB_VpaS_sm030]